ncbi:MAG: ABC transporter ATP-binding protein [Thermoprotei archaeon]|nr:ABC transporter ATP-binding protein [Thermoprotei archaeon]
MSLLEVRDLSVRYHTKKGDVKALNNIWFRLERGKVLGVLGESGCGKTTLAYSIVRILPPNARITSGSILFDGVNLLELSERKMNRVRWKRISIIFQNAMSALSPVHTIGSQLLDVIYTHNRKMTKRKALELIEEKLKIAGLNTSILKRYIHELSGGMRQRVLIAMSLLFNPELVIADEPTTGLDVVLQYQILKEIKSLQEKLGLSMMVISHDVSVVANMSDEVLVLYGGRMMEYGDAFEVFHNPMNPYTYLLLRSQPDIRKPRSKIVEIPGNPPNLISPPNGCIFHPRCPLAKDICQKEEPNLVEVSKNHFTRCHFPDELKEEAIT